MYCKECDGYYDESVWEEYTITFVNDPNLLQAYLCPVCKGLLFYRYIVTEFDACVDIDDN